MRSRAISSTDLRAIVRLLDAKIAACAQDKRAAFDLLTATRDTLAHMSGATSREYPGRSLALERYRETHWGNAGNGRFSKGRAPDPLSPEGLTKLGDLTEIVYRTTKRGDPENCEYEHAFKRPLPVLAYNSGGLVVIGGGYRVTRGGIVG